MQTQPFWKIGIYLKTILFLDKILLPDFVMRKDGHRPF